jgi:hypothetical protein
MQHKLRMSLGCRGSSGGDSRMARKYTDDIEFHLKMQVVRNLMISACVRVIGRLCEGATTINIPDTVGL